MKKSSHWREKDFSHWREISLFYFTRSGIKKEENGGRGRKGEERANNQRFQVRNWVQRLGHEFQGQGYLLEAGI